MKRFGHSLNRRTLKSEKLLSSSTSRKSALIKTTGEGSVKIRLQSGRNPLNDVFAEVQGVPQQGCQVKFCLKKSGKIPQTPIAHDPTCPTLIKKFVPERAQCRQGWNEISPRVKHLSFFGHSPSTACTYIEKLWGNNFRKAK